MGSSRQPTECAGKQLMMDGSIRSSKRIPAPGQVVRVRTRTYLVEAVDNVGGLGTQVRLACLDDDAQGQPLEVIWEIEIDAQILDSEAWQSIGNSGFDPPRNFSAYIHSLRWNCVTATDPRLFQSPFRAGIRIDNWNLCARRYCSPAPTCSLPMTWVWERRLRRD